MLDTPEIVQSDAQPTAVIRLTIPRAEIQSAMGPAMQEVLAVVTAQGVGPAGPLYAHHFRMDSEQFDFEVGVPVNAPVNPSGRVTPGEIPAARVARTVYRGGYEGLGAAWGELGQWLASNGHAPAENLWERYISGPESGPDGSAYRTELNRPLAG